MCGRFAVTLPGDAMAQLFGAEPANDLPDVPNYNICPTNPVHVIRSENGSRKLGAMRWGFLPHWYKTPSDGPLLINARAETIAQKPAFAKAARTRRCLIPATGFYEWVKDADGKRLPFYIHPAGEGPLVFAGVWRDWEAGGVAHRTCAIVTCMANMAMSQIHHRMPVLIAPQDWGKWLGEEGHGAATLMQPAPEDALSFYRVDPKVNSNRAAGADLIAAI